MNAKNLILILSIAVLGFTSCSNVTQTNATLKSETDTASFYLGYFMGMQMEQLGFDVNRNAYLAGFNTAMAGKESPADLQEMDMFVNTQIQAASMKKAEKKLDEGKKFLEENGKKSGVITTESGLQYKIETEGSGATPADTSIVKVHYRGTLLDGKEFDSSYSRGEPTEFPANRVIPGWTEALQLMPIGSKWTLYIPSELAYGQRGAGGMIGPNETLIFEVELLEIMNPGE